MRRASFLLCSFFCSASFALPPAPPTIYGSQEGAMVAYDDLLRALHSTPLILLGEKHDSAEHHLLQLHLLGELTLSGKRPALLMEQLDAEYQPFIDMVSKIPGVTTEDILTAGHFNARGWVTDFYRPLIEHALAIGLPVVAANFSRDMAQEILRDPKSVDLPDVAPEVEATIAERIRAAHPIPDEMVPGMVRVQRTRDVLMAVLLEENRARGAVLIAGTEHVRRDVGAPLYLRSPALAIGFVELLPGETPEDMLRDGELAKRFDYIWFTAPARARTE